MKQPGGEEPDGEEDLYVPSKPWQNLNHKTNLIGKEIRSWLSEEGGGIRGRGSKGTNFQCKISKSWRCQVGCGDYS